AKTLVAEGGRQPDVDDRDVRSFPRDGVHQRVAVRDGRDDVEVVVAEQSRQPVAEQREVLGDHDPHGITTRIVVGPPAGLRTSSVPSSAATRRASPDRPLPDGSAPPRPSSVISSTSDVPSTRPRIATRLACACLPAFASASATTKYAALSFVRASVRSTV